MSSLPRSWFGFVAGVFILGLALSAAAAPSPGNSSSTGPALSASASASASVEPVASDSPRAALKEFRHLTRIGDLAGAAHYLDLSSVDQADGPTLAEHLREVLARHLWLELDKVSPASQGNTDDGLPPNQELLGRVPGATGALEPVMLERKSFRPNSHWMFSAETVSHIEGWYDHLGNTWLVQHLPDWLMRMGPLHLRRFQWLGLAPLLLMGWIVGFALTRLASAILQRALTEQTAARLRKLRGPAALGIAVATWYALLPGLGLYQPAEDLVHRWFASALILALFWALWKTVELSQYSVGKAQWVRESLSAHSLILLGARLAKFAVAAAAVIVVLAELGYHATTIITGLGIGGVALALAAQKTVENLFGAFSLAIDQPFREGDTIQVDGISGTVEAIGLRSTRIRTADRTVISIPNGKLADMRVETISRQDRLRFSCTLGVARVSRDRAQQILAGVTELLQREARVDRSSIGVHWIGLNDFSLTLEVGAMFDTTDGLEFTNARERLLLGIVEAIEAAGAELAHPARTFELGERAARTLRAREGDAPPESGPRQQRELAEHGI